MVAVSAGEKKEGVGGVAAALKFTLNILGEMLLWAMPASCNLETAMAIL